MHLFSHCRTGEGQVDGEGQVTVIPVAVLLQGISKALITILVSIATALEHNDVVHCRWWWARQSAAMERNNLIAGVK